MKIFRDPKRWRALPLAFVVLLAACGGETTTAGDSVSDGSGGEAGVEGPSPQSAEDAAEQNAENLQSADDVLDIEVLSVSDGSIATLRDSVVGDRPVLLWFFAPH